MLKLSEHRKAGGAAFVYIVYCEKHFKIGYTTTSIEKRIYSMTTGNPFKIESALILGFENARDAILTERDLHEYYKAFRVRGEWFSIKWRHVEAIAENYKKFVIEDNVHKLTEKFFEINLKIYFEKVVENEYHRVVRIDEDGQQISGLDQVYWLAKKMLEYFQDNFMHEQKR